MLQRSWFARRRFNPALCFLLPLAALFFLLALARRRLTKPQRLPVPVVVVGNLIVGGAGKTPLTLALAGHLRARGFHPGIISRGYGGRNKTPRAVSSAASPLAVGDEPLLLARRAGAPVWIGRDRAAAGRALLAAHPEVDLLLCDDGLQHHRLARDVELAVFDSRGAGNGWLLPAGPLREPLARLNTVDAVVGNGALDLPLPRAIPHFPMRLLPGPFYRLGQPEQSCQPAQLKGRRLYAVAGIGDPERFFRTLEGLGLSFARHPFADHHVYTAADLAFAADGALLMTEKDAVKCAALPLGEAWVLPVTADLPPALVELVVEKIRGRPPP
ncbi:MAG: tetraacyldisaccharide 4'-kinase [Azonexus sp.]|jgi:tetraacyldisaccharide 4'-kinase|nr:tetraacyldisaccharide 4'-kinase [Azonexus sp.]